MVAFLISAATERKDKTSEGGGIRNKEGNRGENTHLRLRKEEEEGADRTDALLIKRWM